MWFLRRRQRRSCRYTCAHERVMYSQRQVVFRINYEKLKPLIGQLCDFIIVYDVPALSITFHNRRVSSRLRQEDILVVLQHS